MRPYNLQSKIIIKHEINNRANNRAAPRTYQNGSDSSLTPHAAWDCSKGAVLTPESERSYRAMLGPHDASVLNTAFRSELTLSYSRMVDTQAMPRSGALYAISFCPDLLMR